MAVKKVGALIKEARTNAGYTQEKLALLVPGLTASDISKAERGEKELTKEQLKTIARVTGVTQKSLLEAPFGKVTSSASGKTSSSTGTTIKVTAAEKKLLELYRAADTDTRKKVNNILKGTNSEGTELLNSLLEGALGQFLK